ncbi:class A beta-lactamase-related serine hydrolase [Clostridium sp. 19966]|uniref:serine hydrolase n=1 Tax=Clostridium sp. 19966 TaxID=2768166 RepID=UPI0028DD48AA|nr:serine hydrolase [Clostridium sp. 19966]MDT8717525.1 class A beta-lactamase-related serine hydrolase [Clostridium sp. 19966]
MKSKQEYIKKFESSLRTEYFVKGDKQNSIVEMMKKTHTPGISVAVIQDYQLAFSKGYGISDMEKSSPVNESTIFQAASISKPVTCMAVMKLAQDGKLDLDEDINSYLKSWKLKYDGFNEKNKVTLRNLLSHTAGINVHGFPGYNFNSKIPTLIQVLNGESPANTAKITLSMEPNTKFSYSGGGYTIVQQVLVDQLGKKFEDIMKELVLEPLKMNTSFYTNAPLDNSYIPNVTAGHNIDGGCIEGKRHVYPEMAAAGLWTTAEDLAKFVLEIQKSLKGQPNRIISKDFMQFMAIPILTGEYNMGLENQKVAQEYLLGHDGGNEGYCCSMLFHKEKGYGLILMTNSNNGYQMKLPILRSAATAFGWNNILRPDYEKSELSAETKNLFMGSYKLEFDISIKVFADNNKLFYKIGYFEPKKLEYVGNYTFIDTDRKNKFEFVKDENKIYMNESILESLNDGEKLACDYIEEGNIEQAVNIYKRIIEEKNIIKFSLEGKLNNAGYNCLGNNNEAAINLLKVNTILFPDSANAWDSLGEAYFENGQYELSIEAMKNSLQYNQNNKNALFFIEKAKKYLMHQ